MHVKFLFWNIRKGQGKRIYDCISNLAKMEFDVLIFAESPTDASQVLGSLNKPRANRYVQVTGQSKRLRFFYRQDGCLVGSKWNERYCDDISDRITAIECHPQNALSLIIVGAHLESGCYVGLGGRAEFARGVSNNIKTIEKDRRHTRTILVGDLNLNPFDQGLVQPSALHAIMCRKLVGVVPGHDVRKDSPVFYNPMWSCYGDRLSGRTKTGGEYRPPGTYYYDQPGDPDNSFWQMYDQVLLRPELMNSLVNLEILSTDGEEEFLTPAGKPRKAQISDHLPIAFELHL